jgi:hypothetical protein
MDRAPYYKTSGEWERIVHVAELRNGRPRGKDPGRNSPGSER